LPLPRENKQGFVQEGGGAIMKKFRVVSHPKNNQNIIIFHLIQILICFPPKFLRRNILKSFFFCLIFRHELIAHNEFELHKVDPLDGFYTMFHLPNPNKDEDEEEMLRFDVFIQFRLTVPGYVIVHVKELGGVKGIHFFVQNYFLYFFFRCHVIFF
jgi:hypothetical protein